MSYILDALKKAEQSRSAGKAPDLFTLQSSDTPARSKPLWPWLLAGLLLLNVAALTYWSQTGTQANARPAIPPPSLVPGPIAAAPALPEVLRRGVEPTTPPSVTTAPVATAPAVEEPAAPRSLPPVSAPLPASLAPAQPVEKSAAPALKKQDVAPSGAAPQANQNAVAPGTVTSPTPPPPVNTALVVPTPPTAPAKPDTVPAPRVMPLAELPPAVQQELPKMAIAMHMYSGRPANRMASINDRTLREGDELSPGLKLIEITPDGMIFSYKGYRFKKPIN